MSTMIFVFITVLSTFLTAQAESPPVILPPPLCYWNGTYYKEGESFQKSPCHQCHCYSGRVICALEDCFLPVCVDPVSRPDRCCPVCPNGPNCFLGKKKIPANKDYHVGSQICRCLDDHQFGVMAVCKQQPVAKAPPTTTTTTTPTTTTTW